MTDKEVKLPNGKTLIFAEGCFDSFDSQEEIDAAIKAIVEEMGSMTDEELDEQSVPYLGPLPEPKPRQ